MRKFIISAALLTATMAVATPAAAQYGGQGYGYDAQHRGQGYGYDAQYRGQGSGYGEFRSGGIERQLVEIRQQIRIGFDRGMLSRGEVARLSHDADRIQERLQRRAWDGLSFREREDLQHRIQDLRERLRFERFANRRDRRW